MAYYLNKTPALDSIMLKSFDKQCSDYWNIDDILAEEELVPCTFKEDAKNLGYLDRIDNISNKKQIKEESGNIDKGSKVDIPLWLGICLAQRDFVELKTPIYLTEKYMNNLKAGSEVVNFRL